MLSGLEGVLRGKLELRRFEHELKEYFDVEHAVLVSSGKTALAAILQALKKMFPGRDEVLIPAFTCYSVPSAIVRAGLKVRLCDVDPVTFDFDYGQLTEILTEENGRLLCIVAVHLFGFPADVNRVRKLAADKEIIVVEDAAQAMGAECNGAQLGTGGDVGFFSLGRGKALSTVEGGIIITRRDDIAARIGEVVREMPDYGGIGVGRLLLFAFALMVFLKPSFFWLPRQLPFLRLGETIYDPNFRMRKMSAFQAGLTRGWKRKLLGFRANRAEKARALLGRLELMDMGPSWFSGEGLPDLIRLPLRIDSTGRREFILSESVRMGLGISRTYPDSVAGIPELRAGFNPGRYPVSREKAETIITLPVHPYVTESDMDRIADLLKRAH
jgi:dTDP-4-amino-4,6-dideoxygalactose transaminase